MMRDKKKKKRRDFKEMQSKTNTMTNQLMSFKVIIPQPPPSSPPLFLFFLSIDIRNTHNFNVLSNLLDNPLAYSSRTNLINSA